MEFDLKITRFNHYAEVYVGLGNSGTERKSYIWLNKGDDGVARCHFRISSGPDFTSEAAKPFEGDVTAGRHYRMEYNALKRSVEWLVSDAAGRELHRSEPIKSTGPFAADQIWFRVITSQNWKGTDLSGIYYDPVGRWILLRSHICTEGHYPYLIECRFDNLVVRYFD